MKRVIKILSVIFLIGILVSLIFWGKDTKQAKARTFSSDELLTKAQSALKQQDCTDAIAWSRQGLQSSPDYADIKIVMGRAFLLNGQPDSAEKIFLSAWHQQRPDADVLPFLVNIELSKGDTVTALDDIGHYLGLDPMDTSMWLKKYSLLLDRKNYVQASSLYRAFRTRFHSGAISAYSFRYWQESAQQQHRLGDLRAERAAWEQALYYQPSDTAALRSLALMALGSHDPVRARIYNERLLRTDSLNVETLLRQSGIESALHDDRRAAFYASKALQREPGNILLRRNVADTYLRAAKDASPQDRIRWAAEVLRLYPSNREALLYVINGHIALQEYAAALTTVNQALRYYPSDRELTDKKIGILYDSKNYTACASFLESILQKDTTAQYIRTYDDAELQIALAAIRSGDWSHALTAVQKGLSFRPDNKVLLEQELAIYDAEGSPTQALAVVDQLLLSGPADPVYLFKKAGLLEEEGDPQSAVAITSSLRYRYPDHPEYAKAYNNELLSVEIKAAKQGDWLTVLSTFHELGKEQKPDRLAWEYAISAYGQLHDTLQLIAFTDSALTSYPQDSFFMVKRSVAIELRNDYPGALTITRELLHRYPADTSLQKLYLDQLSVAGKFYEKDNRNDTALALFLEVHAVQPNDTFASENLSAIYFVKKQYDSSIAYAEMGLRIDSTNEFLLLKQASSYEELKEYSKAYASTKKLLALRSTHQLVEYGEYLKSKTYRNKIGITHLQSVFSSPAFASVTGLLYIHQTDKATFTGTLNFGDRNAGSGVQGGLDV